MTNIYNFSKLGFREPPRTLHPGDVLQMLESEHIDGTSFREKWTIISSGKILVERFEVKDDGTPSEAPFLRQPIGPADNTASWELFERIQEDAYPHTSAKACPYCGETNLTDEGVSASRGNQKVTTTYRCSFCTGYFMYDEPTGQNAR